MPFPSGMSESWFGVHPFPPPPAFCTFQDLLKIISQFDRASRIGFFFSFIFCCSGWRWKSQGQIQCCCLFQAPCAKWWRAHKKTAPVGINLISGLESNVGSVEQEFCGVKDQRCLIHSTCEKFKCPGSKWANSAPKSSVSNGQSLTPSQALNLTDLFWFYDVIIFKLEVKGKFNIQGVFLSPFCRLEVTVSDFMKCSLFHPGFVVIYALGLFSFTDLCLCLPLLLFLFFLLPAQSQFLDLWCIFLCSGL